MKTSGGNEILRRVIGVAALVIVTGSGIKGALDFMSVGPTGHAIAERGDTITLIPDSELPRGMLMAMQPSPHQAVVQTVQIVLAYMNRPEPADAWRRARLPALAAVAARAGPLLTADERRQLATGVLSASRTARDPEVRTGLMSVASRFGDK
jgi:hypothetical protein